MKTSGQNDAPELLPSRCSKCGHEFALKTPDPFWCPQCGRLWSRGDSLLTPKVQSRPGEPPPVELTPAERARYRLAFVIVFVGTPVAMLGMAMMSDSMRQWVPKMICDTGIFDYGFMPALGTLMLGCLV